MQDDNFDAEMHPNIKNLDCDLFLECVKYAVGAMILFSLCLLL